MSGLPTALQASFASGRCMPILMLRVDLPSIAPLCLLYGSGEVAFDGQTFKGEHPDFGALDALDPPEDGLGDTAPSISFVLLPKTDAASITLANPLYQGSRVRLWVGGLDPSTGALIGTYSWFEGLLDRPLITLDRGVREVEFDCVSGFEQFFLDTEGQRLADSSHQEIWPGETGFIYVSGVARKKLWGPGEKPQNGVIYGNTSGVGGFGGLGGGYNRSGTFSGIAAL